VSVWPEQIRLFLRDSEAPATCFANQPGQWPWRNQKSSAHLRNRRPLPKLRREKKSLKVFQTNTASRCNAARRDPALIGFVLLKNIRSVQPKPSTTRGAILSRCGFRFARRVGTAQPRTVAITSCSPPHAGPPPFSSMNSTPAAPSSLPDAHRRERDWVRCAKNGRRRFSPLLLWRLTKAHTGFATNGATCHKQRSLAGTVELRQTALV
jgi:hypothetical protein